MIDLFTQQRHTDLCKEINRHNQLYYNQAQPEITDAEYDDLFRELQKIEAEFPELITTDSPSQKIGAPAAEKFAPSPHAVPMLSLRFSGNCSMGTTRSPSTGQSSSSSGW